jgi:hypothetical protein
MEIYNIDSNKSAIINNVRQIFGSVKYCGVPLKKLE